MIVCKHCNKPRKVSEFYFDLGCNPPKICGYCYYQSLKKKKAKPEVLKHFKNLGYATEEVPV